MKDPHQIMKDKNFWLNLEFNMSGRLLESPDKEVRKYWIDGFNPQFITDTKIGVHVEGEIWVAEGQKSQTKCRFLASVPQRLLHRQVRDYDFEIIALDIERKYVEINIETRGSSNVA